ncbi:MAG: ribonuclease Y [Opitutaceae bacterium]|nr:ribonuclease Y [Opitutaceae bacterium]
MSLLGESPAWTFAISALTGVGAGFALSWLVLRQSRRVACERAANVVELAKREAQVAASEIRAKTEEELSARRAESQREQDRREIEVDVKLREIRNHEESLALLDFQLEARQERLAREAAAIKQGRDAVRAQAKGVRERLEELAHMDAADIKKALREEVMIECQDDLRQYRKEFMDRSEADLKMESKRVLLALMQRMASQPNHDVTATIVQLPNDEMKGRIIGREGRNIKSFEATTGVTLLIDESPNMVLISSFDPVRREVAKIALQALVADGRIHPASIEDQVHRAQKEINVHVLAAAEAAVQKLKLSGIHPEILQVLGRLQFRHSFSQNVLDHSIEVAQFASLIASELGLDPQLAKRAGLLHDLGKAIEAELEGSHAHIGAEFARRFGEAPLIVNAIAAHHEEVKPESLYAGIVILADTLSAIRPGARAESMAAYIERLQRLERIALDIPGVQQAYAIQAGREVRVVVAPSLVGDSEAREIASLIRQRIEDELQYPSTIKIIVIREQRFVETAT